MKPTDKIAFVKEVSAKDPNQEKWEVVDKSKNFEVTAVGSEVTKCKVGDYIIFTNAHKGIFDGKEIIAIEEADIVGVSNV